MHLPLCSPDLEPQIEEAFSKVKGILRKAQAQTPEALIEALDEALATVGTSDARSFLSNTTTTEPLQVSCFGLRSKI